MTWKINYYSDKLQEEIFVLPETLLAKYLKITDLMKTYGANLGEPHTKAMGEDCLN